MPKLLAECATQWQADRAMGFYSQPVQPELDAKPPVSGEERRVVRRRLVGGRILIEAWTAEELQAECEALRNFVEDMADAS